MASSVSTLAIPGGITNVQNVADQYRLNGELPPDLATQEQGLSRKQQIANLLIQRGLRGLPGGQMAGRFYVKDSPAQGAAQLAEVLAGAFGTHLVDKGQKEIGRQRQAGLDEVRDAWLHAQSPVPAVPPSNLNPSPTGAPEPAPGPSASPQQDVTQALMAQLGPNPSQANLPQGIPNDLQQPIGGGQVTHPMTGQVLDPSSIATPPMPGEPPPPQMAEAPPMQTADMPTPQGTPIAMPPQNQGPVSPGTPGGPRDPHEIRNLITQAMLHQDPLVRHFGQFMAQQQAGQQEHEAQRAMQAQLAGETVAARRESTAQNLLTRVEQMKQTAALTGMQIEARMQAGKDANDLKRDLADQTAEIKKMEIAAHHEQLQQGKTPPGYRTTKDGNLEAIPGGPADLKQQGVLNQDTSMLQNSTSGLDRLATQANLLLTHKGLGGITGMAGSFPNLPGGSAADAEAQINTLKSQIGFGVLQEMRNNSKTGGALGSVSDAEGKRLENNLAALDKAQSLEQMQSSLRNIIDYANSAKERLANAYNMKHKNGPPVGAAPAAAPSGPATIKSDAEFDALPSGSLFIGPDGKTRTKP